MAQPVWVLSVDLQTKTATFQSGMAEAARSARSAFTEIKGGAGEMGREVGTNMFEARHGVMLLGEEFGIRLPRALTAFITSIGPVGAAMEAAFPFLAVAVGATLLIQALVAMHEAGVKLTQDQIKFGTAVQDAFNVLDQKILQSGIRADDLRNNHLGALSKQLQIIDMQSMAELVHTFGEVAKSADTVFEGLKSHWYTFGIGATGAKSALDKFQTQYDNLLAKGKDGEASDLLKGTRESAEKVLALQKQAKSGWDGMKGSAGTNTGASADYNSATNALKAAGVGFTEKEVQAQQALVEALQAQVGIEEKIAALKKSDDSNATLSTAKTMSAEKATADRQAVESQIRMGEAAVAADRATANAELDIKRASIAERLAVETEFANREYEVALAGNAAQLGALSKLANDYPTQLKALHEKAEELAAQHAVTMAEITAKSAVAQNAKDLADTETREKENIGATQEGSAARLAAIDVALGEERAANMADLASYRELLTQRVETLRQMSEEEDKLRAASGMEAAENAQKMGELSLAAQKQNQALQDSARRVTAAQRVQEATAAANAEYQLKVTAMGQELAALDKSGKEYLNKVQEIQDKERQLTQQHENELTEIKDKAETERNTRILSAEQQFNNTIAAGLTQVLMGHKSFASMMTSIGTQVVSGMMENATKSILANDYTKESDAAAAARKAYLAGASMGPAGIVLGPVFGAAAFAAVMAFQGGTDRVPGVGTGDTVPSMLEPGEGVVPGGVMDGLRGLVRNGGMNRGHTINVRAHFAPHIHAIDADGVEGMLTKHAGTFQRHLEGTLRRMNH